MYYRTEKIHGYTLEQMNHTLYIRLSFLIVTCAVHLHELKLSFFFPQPNLTSFVYRTSFGVVKVNVQRTIILISNLYPDKMYYM